MHGKPIKFKNRLVDLLLMKGVWVGLLFLFAALSGCVEEPAPGPAEPAPGQRYGEVLDPDDPLSAYTWNGTNLIYDELEPPALEAGTAWTYTAGGVWALTSELTVVVAEDAAGDTVFGAPHQRELVNAAIWGQYWYGPMDAALNHKDIEAKLFDWPLHDGKSFILHGMAMSVVAALVETPLGTMPGYEITGEDGDIAVAYTYVPEIGYLTSYSFGTADGSEVWERLELKEVGSADEAYWFEGAPPFLVATGENPLGPGPNVTIDRYEVAAGHDELVFAGLGSQGAGATAQALDPVQGGQWGFEDGDGYWDWKVGRVSATPGPWLFEAHTDGSGWAYFEGRPVTWVPLTT